MIVPNVFQQHGASDNLSRVLHQIFEQSKFSRLQWDLIVAADDAMRQSVKLEVADAIDRVLAAAAPAARQRLHPREQFGKRVRLRKVVVPAGAQSLDAVVDLRKR